MELLVFEDYLLENGNRRIRFSSEQPIAQYLNGKAVDLEVYGNDVLQYILEFKFLWGVDSGNVAINVVHLGFCINDLIKLHMHKILSGKEPILGRVFLIVLNKLYDTKLAEYGDYKVYHRLLCFEDVHTLDLNEIKSISITDNSKPGQPVIRRLHPSVIEEIDEHIESFKTNYYRTTIDNHPVINYSIERFEFGDLIIAALRIL